MTTEIYLLLALLAMFAAITLHVIDHRKQARKIARKDKQAAAYQRDVNELRVTVANLADERDAKTNDNKRLTLLVENQQAKVDAMTRIRVSHSQEIVKLAATVDDQRARIEQLLQERFKPVED